MKVWPGDIEQIETARGLIYTIYEEASYDYIKVKEILHRSDGTYQVVFPDEDLSDSDLIIYPSGIRQVFIKK